MTGGSCDKPASGVLFSGDASFMRASVPGSARAFRCSSPKMPLERTTHVEIYELTINTFPIRKKALLYQFERLGIELGPRLCDPADKSLRVHTVDGNTQSECVTGEMERTYLFTLTRPPCEGTGPTITTVTATPRH